MPSLDLAQTVSERDQLNLVSVLTPFLKTDSTLYSASTEHLNTVRSSEAYRVSRWGLKAFKFEQFLRKNGIINNVSLSDFTKWAR